jgi:hypothetical protein
MRGQRMLSLFKPFAILLFPGSATAAIGRAHNNVNLERECAPTFIVAQQEGRSPTGSRHQPTLDRRYREL